MRVRHVVEYAGVLVGATLARWLPLSASRRIGAWAGAALYRISSRHYGEAMENLRLAFPDLDESQRSALARESHIHFMWNLIDAARTHHWSAERTVDRVALVGKEHIDRVLEAGKGVIMLTLHLGNFELGSRRMALEGIPLLVLNRPLANPLLHAYINVSRERFGARLIDRDQAARPILKHLRANGMVAVLNDRYARTGAVLAPLFGARAATAAGVATLALRAGATVLPCYIAPDGDERHTLHVLPPVDMPATGDRARDIETSVAAHNAALEAIIRLHPEEWMWRHRRFRHSPDLAEGAASQVTA